MDVKTETEQAGTQYQKLGYGTVEQAAGLGPPVTS